MNPLLSIVTSHPYIATTIGIVILAVIVLCERSHNATKRDFRKIFGENPSEFSMQICLRELRQTAKSTKDERDQKKCWKQYDRACLLAYPVEEPEYIAGIDSRS